MTEVRLETKHPKLGAVTLVASLTLSELREYAVLDNESQRFNYLMGKDPQVILTKDQYQGLSVSDDAHENNKPDNVSETGKGEKSLSSETSNKPVVTRKVRLSINGKDTGWVDVNDENESEYQELFKEVQQHQKQLESDFKNIFNRAFDPFRFGTWPSLERLEKLGLNFNTEDTPELEGKKGSNALQELNESDDNK